MKIGLIDVDSHNFPNLCLMKLSEYHTRRGDRVEWWSPKGRYDLVYKSRVFTDTYSKDTIVVNNAEKVIQGGTGYGPGGKDLPYIKFIRPKQASKVSADPDDYDFADEEEYINEDEPEPEEEMEDTK